MRENEFNLPKSINMKREEETFNGVFPLFCFFLFVLASETKRKFYRRK